MLIISPHWNPTYFQLQTEGLWRVSRRCFSCQVSTPRKLTDSKGSGQTPLQVIGISTGAMHWWTWHSFGYGSIPIKIPFLGEWTSIYQKFWGSPGVQGFDTLPFSCSEADLDHAGLLGSAGKKGFGACAKMESLLGTVWPQCGSLLRKMDSDLLWPPTTIPTILLQGLPTLFFGRRCRLRFDPAWLQAADTRAISGNCQGCHEEGRSSANTLIMDNPWIHDPFSRSFTKHRWGGR